MKNFRFLTALLCITVVTITIDSCKKGPEDPFLTFRSRNSKIMGTWTLNAIEDYTYIKDLKSTTTNTVNTDNSTDNTYEKYLLRFDGSTLQIDETDNSDGSSSSKTYNGISWVSGTSSYDNEKTETWKYTYSLAISLYDDNTYSIAKTQNASYYSIVDHNSTTSGSTTLTTKNDTSYTPVDNSSTTEVGTWGWADDDDSGDDKIMLSAGPLSGYLIKLSNKELHLDPIFSSWWLTQMGVPSSYINASSSSNTTNQNDYDEQLSTQTLSVHSVPPAVMDGKRKTATTTVTTVSGGKSTWEKTDKEESRKSE